MAPSNCGASASLACAPAGQCRVRVLLQVPPSPLPPTASPVLLSLLTPPSLLALLGSSPPRGPAKSALCFTVSRSSAGHVKIFLPL